MLYNLTVDEKIEVWKRTHVNVEADNLDEAINKCLDDDYEVTNHEILYETERLLSPNHTNGVTMEIYLDNSSKYEPIYTNDPYK